MVDFLTAGERINAQGYGASSLGGWDGDIITVTNLNDSGAGSLRAALAQSGARMVRFSVSGTIDLQSILSISNGRVTVEGQTAPNGGICTKGFGWQVAAEDVVIQHMRMRPGTNADPGNNDGLYITNTARRVVIDHCSLSWAQDENFSIYGQDITIQWCIISEGLKTSGHPDGEHSMGGFWTTSADRVSLHHNLFAHNYERNPTAAVGHADCINNVCYNGGLPAIATNESANVTINFVKNWQKSGANTVEGSGYPNIRFANNGAFTMQGYIEGNIGPNRANDALPENDCLYPLEDAFVVAQRFAYTGSYPVTETSAVDAKTAVLAGAGATLPKRDAVDARVVADVDAGTGAIIDNPNDVGGWPDLTV
jgi:pectate lyase